VNKRTLLRKVNNVLVAGAGQKIMGMSIGIGSRDFDDGTVVVSGMSRDVEIERMVKEDLFTIEGVTGVICFIDIIRITNYFNDAEAKLL